MKQIKLSLLVVALLASGFAFAEKAGDTFIWEDANGNQITDAQARACPNTGNTLCAQKIDVETQEVVATYYYIQ